MARGHDVSIGERFKLTPKGGIFEVGSIRTEGCLVPHARLFNITDPMDKKFISVEALTDTKLYAPVKNPDLELVDGAVE